MLAHEMLVHQVIINALKLWVNAAGNPRHTCHFLHDDRIMDGVVGIFPGRTGRADTPQSPAYAAARILPACR